MNVKEVEVVHKEKVYELTESELKELKDKYFNEGIDSVLDYIVESYNNYILEKNIGGVFEFVNEVIKFCINKHGINNHYNMSFQEYIDNDQKMGWR